MTPHLIENSKCTGCGACYAACSHNAISMQYDRNGFLVPVVNAKGCIGCTLCEKACPALNDNRLQYSDPCQIVNYTAWSTDDEVAMHSSSGGVFAQIAINLIKERSAHVYGAKLLNDNTCVHICIDKIDALEQILGTKYIQSDTSNAYRQIKTDLRNGITVLYCGTPCQVAGLYSYLKYKYIDQLYTIELICHGVNSKFTADFASEYYSASNIISFRDKTAGWCSKGTSRKCFHCQYQSDVVIKTQSDKDVYYKIFGNTHRLSCYNCSYAKIFRVADLSLGDQWGLSDSIQNREILGANLVVCNTPKGNALITPASNIYKIKNENKNISAYPFFYPGASELRDLGQYFWIIKKLPFVVQKTVLLQDWKKNWLMILYKIISKYALKKHHAKTIKTINAIRKEQGWL